MQSRLAYDQAKDYESNWLADAAVGTIQYGVSVATDLGVTMYNSLVPESYETSTLSLLSSMNDDL